MASAVAATSVSEILRPHRKTDSVAEREGFGPWVSPERVGPESSNENHRRYPGGPGVRISLPPALSPLRTSFSGGKRGKVRGDDKEGDRARAGVVRGACRRTRPIAARIGGAQRHHSSLCPALGRPRLSEPRAG